jgi:hypothetical protein
MSLELEQDLIPGYEHYGWVDFNRLTCDLCGAQTPWMESGELNLSSWHHLLGLDCCPECDADLHASVRPSNDG